MELHRQLKDGNLSKEHIFYKLIKNALSFSRFVENWKTGIGNEPFTWDEDVLSFIETLEFHGHEKIINLLRGPGLDKENSRKGGIGMFDWEQWNVPLPGKHGLV